MKGDSAASPLPPAAKGGGGTAALRRSGLHLTVLGVLVFTMLAWRPLSPLTPSSTGATRLAWLGPAAGEYSSPRAAATCDAEALAATVAAPSLLNEGCLRFAHACVDQGSVVVYKQPRRPQADKQRKQQAAGAVPPQPVPPLPYFVEAAEDRRWGPGHYPVPLRVRPAAFGSAGGSPAVMGEEGAAYLREPVFSQCTVPVVFYTMYPHNFAHFFRGKWAVRCCCFLLLAEVACGLGLAGADWGWLKPADTLRPPHPSLLLSPPPSQTTWASCLASCATRPGCSTSSWFS